MVPRPRLRLLVAAFVLLLARSGGADAGFNVVVNKANPVSTLSRSELKRLVTGGTKTWSSGAVVQLGVIPSDAAETAHLASLLETSPRELLGVIQQQVFKGEARRPVVLRSSADCVAMVSSNPGGFCVASGATAVGDGAHVVSLR